MAPLWCHPIFKSHKSANSRIHHRLGFVWRIASYPDLIFVGGSMNSFDVANWNFATPTDGLSNQRFIDWTAVISDSKKFKNHCSNQILLIWRRLDVWKGYRPGNLMYHGYQIYEWCIRNFHGLQSFFAISQDLAGGTIIAGNLYEHLVDFETLSRIIMMMIRSCMG